MPQGIREIAECKKADWDRFPGRLSLFLVQAPHRGEASIVFSWGFRQFMVAIVSLLTHRSSVTYQILFLVAQLALSETAH